MEQRSPLERFNSNLTVQRVGMVLGGAVLAETIESGSVSRLIGAGIGLGTFEIARKIGQYRNRSEDPGNEPEQQS